ncbi:hypothetical protein EDD86DRAFT_221199 [Gorgonomyces haynaldii]|nr:hypothetical protein EDD86DRAFT_221199 [Gorgonomyces haynaldii]
MWRLTKQVLHLKIELQIAIECQKGIQKLTSDLKGYCDRTREASPEDFQTFSHHFHDSIKSMNDNLHKFIECTTGAFITVDLKRNSMELTRFVNAFETQIEPGKNADAFRQLMTAVNTNVDFIIRRCPGQSRKVCRLMLVDYQASAGIQRRRHL